MSNSYVRMDDYVKYYASIEEAEDDINGVKEVDIIKHSEIGCFYLFNSEDKSVKCVNEQFVNVEEVQF